MLVQKSGEVLVGIQQLGTYSEVLMSLMPKNPDSLT